MDYGQPLRFGVTIGPQHPGPVAAVRLAVHAERAGLDVVTVRGGADPAHLDDWTLLSWIAGRTTRIRLGTDGLDAGGQLPAVLARAVSSLDLLTGGRVELGLRPAGTPPGTAAGTASGVDPDGALGALDETLQILLGLWNIGTAGSLQHSGPHYRVPGAGRGPAPAHRMPVHLAGDGRALLDLIGRRADGWILTGGEATAGRLQVGNRILDEAAVLAGRDPREIRRTLRIRGGTEPVQRHAEWLVELVLDGGVGTVLLAGQRLQQIERFAHEVAPRVREAVAAERTARATAVGTVAPLRVRRRRREAIDYARIPCSLADGAVEPGDDQYPLVRSTYLRSGAPGLVLRPADADQVADAVRWAGTQPVPLSIRSGGHGFSGRSTNDGGIVVDLARMRRIEVVDATERIVRVEAGARWGEVAAALRPYGWAISSGDSGGVGVGGLATAGGIGFLGRANGLAIDHVRAVDLATADGTLLRADANAHPELFWAVRGAGFAVGVVTAFFFRAAEVTDVGFGQLTFDVSDDVAGFLQRWGATVESAPEDTTSFLTMGGQRGGRLVAHTMTMVDSDDRDTVIERLQRLAALAPLIGQQAVIAPYADVLAAPPRGPHRGAGDPVARSGLLEHVTAAFAADAERLLRSGAASFFQIRAFGGATGRVAADATAFAHRSAQFSVLAMGVTPDRIDPVWDPLRRHYDGAYLSFDTGTGPHRLHDAFPPATLARLRAVKRRYDPANVLRDNLDLAPDDPMREVAPNQS